VIPTLNEAEAIAHVLDDVRDSGFENAIVVDGYSNDGTADIVTSKGVNVLMQKRALVRLDWSDRDRHD
jgi:glycosyltransferase involved in cell wall biosynthesis